MASRLRFWSGLLWTRIALNRRSYPGLRVVGASRCFAHVVPTVGLVGALGLGVGTALCLDSSDVYADKQPVPRRLQRFSNFASVEYNGVAYMTPQDLLDSLVLDAPRERVFRNVLEKRAVDRMLRNTPGLKRGHKNMFRSLGHNGIISYAEYLFLLTLLTKSNSNFKIAFSIFDDDENSRIDKEEFLAIRSLIVSKGGLVKKLTPDEEDQVMKTHFGLDTACLPIEMDVSDISREECPIRFEALMVSKSSLRRQTTVVLYEQTSTMDETDCKRQDTTILVHLFGPKGNDTLSFEQFEVFYNNLQRELIEIEFHEFARGKREIAAVDFAKLVLRYSLVSNRKYDLHLKRVASRVSLREPGITLDQFEQFSKFLNNLEDFSRAVRLYAAADLPVCRSEFQRAVKCATGLQLDANLVDVIFKIFDVNNDGHLSYNEFIEIMNDRLHRGFKNQTRGQTGSNWQMFKQCITKEMNGFAS